jgi:hypothetical protein
MLDRRLKEADVVLTERKKNVRFTRLEPRIFELSERCTVIILEEITSSFVLNYHLHVHDRAVKQFGTLKSL